jgi:hypothetical protein
MPRKDVGLILGLGWFYRKLKAITERRCEFKSLGFVHRASKHTLRRYGVLEFRFGFDFTQSPQGMQDRLRFWVLVYTEPKQPEGGLGRFEFGVCRFSLQKPQGIHARRRAMSFR